MKQSVFDIQTEHSGNKADMEALLDRAFGIDRRTKTAYRLREGGQPVLDLCFSAFSGPRLVGSIQFWPLIVGGTSEALLLGPLAVDPDVQGQGCGLALMRHGLDVAQQLGHALVILVGDAPYYARVGFSRVPDGQVIMPGPVDPERLLARELVAGSLDGVSGLVQPRHRVIKGGRSR